MRLEYDATTNAAYLYLVDEITRGMVKRTRAVEHEGINLDFSGSDTLIGIEVLNARAHVPALLLGRALLSEQAPANVTEDETVLRAVRSRSDDQYKSGGVYLSLEKAPLVTFTVRCPSCQALHRAEANCGRIVFDAIGLHCSCGVDTDLSPPAAGRMMK